MGRRSRAASAAARSTPTQEGGAHTRRVRAAVPRRPRAGEPAEAERDRGQGDDPAGASDPAARRKKLDAITTEDVQRLKRRLTDTAPKTVNNVLTVLNVMLKKAVEWDVIERMPVHDPVAADPEAVGASSTTSTSTNGWLTAAKATIRDAT